MSRRIFLDFDGTLIDSRRRQYNLFSEIVSKNTLSFDAYWKCKRDNVNQRTLLQSHFHYSDTQISAFKEAWMEKIEEPVRLLTDVAFEGVQEFLAQTSQKSNLFLVTGRQHHDSLIEQMKNLGFLSYFSDVFNTAQQCSKAELIRSHSEWNTNDVFVGDTGEDILAGQELGMRTVAVTSGALSGTTLEKYQPNLMLKSVVHFDISML
jgi:phosphoglycolate phosphatase